MTPSQREALAALCGVTPESRPDLYVLRSTGPWCWKSATSVKWAYALRKSLPDPTAAAADPREVDAVYLSGLLWALKDSCHQPITWAEQASDIKSGDFDDAWCAEVMGHKHYNESKNKPLTLALLRAAQAAGVEQVCRIMEESPHE